MTKFQRLQKISSIIPFWSTFLIAIITMIELKRHSASKRIWCYFVFTVFGAGIVVYFLNVVVMTGQHPFLNVVASGLILAIANILFVELQIKSIQTKQNRTKPKTNVCIYLIVFSVVVAILGVGILLVSIFTPTTIIDTNGESDTSLISISLEEIISAPDGYSSRSSYTLKEGSNTYVTGRMKKFDHQECSFSCSEVNGIMTLQATKTKSDFLTLQISSQLDEGNMEIVVIVDGEYYDSVPVNQNSTILLSDIADKNVVVRMAAESAKVKIAVKRTEGRGQGDGSVVPSEKTE